MSKQLLRKREVIQIAQNRFGSKEVVLLGCTLNRRSQIPLGYFGDHLVLELICALNHKEFHEYLFVKTFPNSTIMGEDFLRKTGLFQREVDFYKILFTEMRLITGTPDWCPKYYYNNEEVLVLEDLSTQNFRLCPEQLLLDFEHLQVTLNTLAAMHASSILLEEEKSQFLDEAYPDLFREILYDTNVLQTPYQRWITKGITDLQTGVEFLDKYTEAEKIVIKEKLPGVLWELYPLNKKSQRYKNVLVHNDMWRNNILFKYENDKPVDCRLVDYQKSRYAPPAHDVMCLLYLTTVKSFRDEHETFLVEFYYDRLKTHLNAKNFNVEDFIRLERFKESCQHYKLVALIQGTLSMHFLLGSADEKTEDILAKATKEEYDDYVEKHREEYIKHYFQNPQYLSTVPELFNELIDNFVLKEPEKKDSLKK